MNEDRKQELEKLAKLVREIYGAHGGIESRGVAISKVVQDRYGGHGMIDLTEEQIVSLAQQARDRLTLAKNKLDSRLGCYKCAVEQEEDRDD